MKTIREIMLKRPSGQFYETVVVVWLTLSAASVVLAAATWARLSRQLNAANQAVAIRLEANTIFETLLEAQSSERGFALTHNRNLLDSLDATVTNFPARCRHLASLADNDPALLVRVKRFCEGSEEYLYRQQQAALAVQVHGPAASGLESDEALNVLRRDIAALGATPAALVFDQSARARAQLTRASLTSLVAGVLGLGAGLFAFALSRLTVKHQERERELIEAKLQADRRSEEKTVFLANMSHEIRTPMNAILGFGELLENDVLNDKQRSYLQSIRRSASSLLQLINDMLDMSKIEAGVLELHPEPTDPREICQFTETMFSEPAARKHLQLSWKVDESIPRSLLWDRVRLRQILVNLVGNAVKFTDHGKIQIHIRPEGKATGKRLALLIEVLDTGVGIPSDRLEAIFTPFVQAGAHPDKERQGTGLGLSIVKRLTEMMGGSVTVKSELSRGSVFQLRFSDVAVSEKPATPDSLTKSLAVNFNWLRPATVLGVDDNETNRQLLQAMLNGSHHRLLLASTGPQAIAMARQVKPDIILLDVRMPGMDGRQVLRTIREIPTLRLTPVVAVTASTLTSEEHHLKAQFDGYLQKPYSRQELFDELALFLPRLPAQMDPLTKLKTPIQTEAPLIFKLNASHEVALDQETFPLRHIRHDLKSSLAGVVMSAELLLEQDLYFSDEAFGRSASELLDSGRRLLAIVKTISAHADPTTSITFPEDFKIECAQMHTSAQELCRRTTYLGGGRSLQLAENIIRSCRELIELLEKIESAKESNENHEPVCAGSSDASPKTARGYDTRAQTKPLNLLTPTHSTHGLSGY